MNHQNKNRGFALVELVIGIAVATIVSGMVVAIVQFSSNSFRSTTSEEVTQRQAQAVTSQLNDFVMNTKDAVCYYVENKMVSNDQNYEDITAGSTTDLERVTTKQIRLYEKVSGIVQEQRIEWNKNDQTLLLDEDTSDAKAAVILAKNIADFSVDLKDAFTNRKVYVTVKVVKDDKSYGVDVKTIKLRNNLMINQVPVSDGTGELIKEITGTLISGSTSIDAGESEHYAASVSGYPGVSNDCIYTIEYNGERVTSFDNGAVIINNAGDVSCGIGLSQDYTVVIIATPKEVYESELSVIEKDALSGKLQVQLRRKVVIVPELEFVNKRDIMNKKERFIFTAGELHGLTITNKNWSISSGIEYATINSSTGEVIVEKGPIQGKQFTVKVEANYGTLLIFKETIVTVK